MQKRINYCFHSPPPFVFVNVHFSRFRFLRNPGHSSGGNSRRRQPRKPHGVFFRFSWGDGVHILFFKIIFGDRWDVLGQLGWALGTINRSLLKRISDGFLHILGIFGNRDFSCGGEGGGALGCESDDMRSPFEKRFPGPNGSKVLGSKIQPKRSGTTCPSHGPFTASLPMFLSRHLLMNLENRV